MYERHRDLRHNRWHHWYFSIRGEHMRHIAQVEQEIEDKRNELEDDYSDESYEEINRLEMEWLNLIDDRDRHEGF